MTEHHKHSIHKLSVKCSNALLCNYNTLCVRVQLVLGLEGLSSISKYSVNTYTKVSWQRNKLDLKVHISKINLSVLPYVQHTMSIYFKCFRFEGHMECPPGMAHPSFSVNHSILEAVRPRLKDFHQLLLEPPQVKPAEATVTSGYNWVCIECVFSPNQHCQHWFSFKYFLRFRIF